MAFSHWAIVFLMEFSLLVLGTYSQGELFCKYKNIVFIRRLTSSRLTSVEL